jgi:hypothetical protein
MILSTSQECKKKILRELAIYKFLTVSQMLKLKIGSKNKLYENIQKLVCSGFIKFADYKALLRYGHQLERFHFLTPKELQIS